LYFSNSYFQVNHKTTFDDDGDIVDDSQLLKKSKEGRQYEMEGLTKEDSQEEENLPSGINLEKAKDILKAEDAYDLKKERERIRKMHKEKKRKEKEAKTGRKKGESEEEGVELDQSSNDGSERPNLDWLPDPDKIYGKEGAEESDSDASSVPEQKRRKVEVESDEDDYDESDRKDLADDELLAMQLLNS